MNTNITEETLLLAPGPVQLHPEVQKILSLPMIHHRTPVFDQILKKVLTEVKKIFQTQENVFLLSSTGSGGMEALLINVLHPGDLVLCIVSGKFGERWAEMAEVFGAKVIRHNVEWGKAVNPDDIKKIISENSNIKIVMTQACETSTATAHPIKELAEIVSSTEALFLVDAITALGAYPLPMDEWKIDGIVAGSQKAIMLPTGLSLFSFSQKAWKIIETNSTARFYFDVRKELAANKKGETFFSSNVALIRALDFVISHIETQGGLQNLFKTIHRRAEYTRQMAKVLNLNLFSHSPSDSVTALNVPSQIDGAKLREHLELKYNVVVMGGQDHLKGKILRIGHMGYITDEHLHQTTLRLAQSLKDFDYKINDKEIDLESINKISLNILKTISE